MVRLKKKAPKSRFNDNDGLGLDNPGGINFGGDASNMGIDFGNDNNSIDGLNSTQSETFDFSGGGEAPDGGGTSLPGGNRGKKGGKKRGKKGGKKGAGSVVLGILAILAVIIVISSVVSALIGPTRRDCKKVAATFQEGCNQMDFYKMADCVSPTYRAAIKALLIVADLSEDDIEKGLEMVDQAMGGIFGGLAESSSMTLTEFFKTTTVEPIKVSFMPGKTRMMRCKLLVAGTVDVYIDVTIAKKDRQPYISNIRLAQ